MKKTATMILTILLVLTLAIPAAQAEDPTPPPVPRLTGLSVAGAELIPVFDAGTQGYKVFVPYDAAEASVSTTAEAGFTVTINGTAAASAAIALNHASTPADITVSNGTPEQDFTYHLDIIQENPSALLLSSLTTNMGIWPAFDPGNVSYGLNVPYHIGAVTLGLSAADPASSCIIAVNGTAQGMNTAAALQYGNNSITIQINSAYGHQNTYTLNVYREQPNDPGSMSALEAKFVETFMRLLPERHPFVLAYEEAHGVSIDHYVKEVNGIRVSGVAFSSVGTGHVSGPDPRWWNKSGTYKYPVWGLDCAEFVHWVYHNAGYEVGTSSTELFFGGITGVQRYTPRINRTHWVIPTLQEAKIGDVVYNSKYLTYRAGHGSHSMMFIGTARELGIADVIQKYMPGFPVDAYLVADCGWSDGAYYKKMYRSLRIRGRTSTCGVGVQFFTSIKNNDGTYMYVSPYRNKKTRAFYWTDPATKYTFCVHASMEKQGRPFQHKAGKDKVQYLLNISRPILRND
jgi:hypothetical protein